MPIGYQRVQADMRTHLIHRPARDREEAEKAGCRIERIVVAFEAGRDGFWLARWLKARSIEAHVIHAASVAVSREHRRAKTDRLDAELLKRAFLGWLRGERDHCKVVAIATLKDEDAKRPSRERQSLVGEQSRIVNRMKAALIRLGIRGFNPKLKRAAGRLDDLRTPEGEPIPPNTLAELRRDMERRRLISNQIRQIEEARLKHFEQAPNDGPHAMVRLLARVIGVGIETADMLVHEVLSRNMRDRRAIARYAGLTGSDWCNLPRCATTRPLLPKRSRPKKRLAPAARDCEHIETRPQMRNRWPLRCCHIWWDTALGAAVGSHRNAPAIF